jgi:transposase
MDERLRFVARLLDGDAMSEVCRDFGISRKTGYKIFTRYKDQGLEALCDRSRRPVRYANQLPPQIENQIVTLKREKPHWGARKIRELLVRRLAGEVRIPAKSTIHAVLHRHGLVKGMRRPRSRAQGTPLSRRASRPTICGVPTSRASSSSATAMHLTLKQEATRPPGMNSLQQQARFDDFVREFNNERPHEALAMKTPGEIYSPSPRPYLGLPELTYPLHDRDALVTACGRICMHRKKISISYTLAGQRMGIKEVDEGIWIVSFMHYDLGYIDLEQKTLQPLDNPFGARLLPMS